MATKYEWLVQTPANASDLEARINTRPAHLAHNAPLIADGTLLFGGPSLDTHPETEDGELLINGSIMLVRAESEEAVYELLRNDPYTKAGFWYADKAVVTPMRSVLRNKV